jgi:hypothetical protein
MWVAENVQAGRTLLGDRPGRKMPVGKKVLGCKAFWLRVWYTFAKRTFCMWEDE